MTIRNRELSQFGSFVYITDDTRNIAITTESTPFVGIGTTNPQKKLHIVGDIQVDGSIVFDGELEVGDADLNTSGIITASAFFNTQGDELTRFDSWLKNNDDIYRLSSVGIGIVNPTESLDVIGNIKTSGQFISTVTGTFTTGTAPLEIASRRLVVNLNSDYLRGGEPGGSASGDIVTVDANQTLSNKTLSNPTLTNPTLTNPIVSGSINFGTATLSGPANGVYNLILPEENGTLITASSGGVISGIVTTGNILDGTILNQDIANGTIQNVKLVNSTISGRPLGSNLNNLSAGSFITYSSGSTYNGSSAITVSVAATTANIGNTLISRNVSGDFSAGTVNVINLSATQTVQANSGDFSGNVTAGTVNVINLSATQTVQANSGNFSGNVTAISFIATSDINLKENIKTIENSTETIQSLRGVSFDWKEGGKGSYGVIAQELEEVLPELVNDGEVKAVNYNGIIGVLIEAVKELSEEVQELKKQLNN
jgi:hypothetical protein